MAIQQTKRQSDLEKRLQLLRRQVYGKGPEYSEDLRKPENQINRKTRGSDNSDTLTLRYSGAPSSSESFRTDITYLHQDLLKILIFSSLAIGAQVILSFLLKNHILRISKLLLAQ